jgi:hypothetical protein
MLSVSRSVTINRPREEVYECWRDLDNLPRVIPELECVALQGAGRSHWLSRARPAPRSSGMRRSRPTTRERLSRGVLSRGHRSRIRVKCGLPTPPRDAERSCASSFDSSRRPAWSARRGGLARDDAEAMVREALRRYKQVLETGEVLRSEQSARRRPRARREASGPTRRSGGGVMKAACWMGKGNVELHDLWSLCENSNPNAALAETMMGHAGSGAFGYSHLTGGFAGGQAQYARVPFADVGPLKVESALSDEQVLFLSDILPTGDSQRPVPRPPLHAPAPRAARTRRNRPVVRSSPTGYR